MVEEKKKLIFGIESFGLIEKWFEWKGGVVVVERNRYGHKSMRHSQVEFTDDLNGRKRDVT